MVEIIFRKRKAIIGEVGLFLDTEVFQEEFASIAFGAEVKAECTVPANLRYLKFFWALVGKVADNSPDEFLDKEDCAHRILIEARHYKAVVDHLREKTEIKAKSVSGLSGDTWIRLLKRVTWVVTDKFLPGMDANALKAEIEAMIGPDVAPSAPAAEKRTRAPRAPKAAPAAPVADPEPVDQPDPEPEPDERRVPTNEAEYIAACRGWIAKQTANHADARSYFEGDHHVALRQKCGVGISTRNMLRRELAAKYGEGTPNAQK
jgi:hypothetical protein